ncbi:MAG: hypothetical protein ACYS8Y_13150 [Planctomycetota bacterium]|jgi:class 3 adenylate cyclase
MTQQGLKRKLKVILSADVVGYSRLMDDDEANRRRKLQAFGVDFGRPGKKEVGIS